MKFSYLAVLGLLDSSGRPVKRPVIVLELKGVGGEVLEVPAIIDSGADTTTVNIEIAKALGVGLGEEGEIIGVGKGRVKKWAGNLPFRIKHTDFQLDVPAWYIDSENVNILLGQEAFFDAFSIKFEKSRDVFEIAPAG